MNRRQTPIDRAVLRQVEAIANLHTAEQAEQSAFRAMRRAEAELIASNQALEGIEQTAETA